MSGGAEIALFRQQTNIAGLCKELVLKSVVTIAQRKYVRVEGWTSIATCYGYIPTIESVTETDSGMLAVAALRRLSDLQLISRAEGFVGKDEALWYGGTEVHFNKYKNTEETITRPPRNEYAVRSMAQTRAVAKVCRNACSAIVVLMQENLETTPAEEIPEAQAEIVQPTEPPKSVAESMKRAEATGPAENPDLESQPLTRANYEGGKWKTVVIHFGENYKGKALGDLTRGQLNGWLNWTPKPYKGKVADADKALRLALDVSAIETAE